MIPRKNTLWERFDRDDIAAMAFIVLVFLPPLIWDLVARDFAH